MQKLLILIISIPLYLSAQNLQITSERFSFNSFTMERAVDDTRTQTIDQIIASPKESVPNIYPWGYPYYKAVWHKVDITNTLSHETEYFLYSKHYYSFREYDIYFVDSDGKVISAYFGGYHRFDGKKVSDFPFNESLYVSDIAAGETQSVYIKTVMADSFAAEYEFRIADSRTIIKHILTEQVLLAVMMGILIALIAYNIFVYYTTRSRTYLYYIISLSSITTVAFFFVTGFAFGLMKVDIPWIRYVVLVVPINIIFLLLFSRDILQIPARFPKIDKATKAIMWVAGATGVVFAVFDLADYSALLMLYAMISAVVMISIGVYATYKKQPFARFYMFTTVGFLVFSISATASYLGLIPYSFIASHGLMVGSIVEGFGFSVLLAMQIKSMKEKNTKLEILSSTDELTKLPNRRAILGYLDRVFHRPTVGVIIFDIDHFKRINDTYGHDVGDEALIHIARILVSELGRAQFGRIGGEEFLVVFEGESLPNLEKIANRLRQNIELYPLPSNPDIVMTISLGVALKTHLDAEPKDLIKRADTALYQAKLGGRNTVCVA